MNANSPQSHEPDDIVIPPSTGGGECHPQGQFLARCVDVIDLGQSISSFQGSKPKVVNKLAIVFVSAEGEATRLFTQSTHEKSALRKFLVGWRGPQIITPEGTKLSALKGEPAQIGVTVEKNAGGYPRATIESCVAPLAGTLVPELLGSDYQRDAARWSKLRAAFAAEVAKV